MATKKKRIYISLDEKTFSILKFLCGAYDVSKSRMIGSSIETMLRYQHALDPVHFPEDII